MIDRYQPQMLRIAMLYTPSRAIAEEVVQETWLGVITGLPGFEGRSSLKTWIFRILTNVAKTRGQREHRSVPFSSLGDPEPEGPSVDPARFLPADHERWPNQWSSPPSAWDEVPESRFLALETLQHVERAIARLPDAQREVVTMRDVNGWSSAEVCNVLGITETNQRVLLHRGRTKVRRALEEYFDKGVTPT